MPLFIVFGLTAPEIEPESTDSVADALSTLSFHIESAQNLVSFIDVYFCFSLLLALDLPFYDIFAPQKVPLLKISDDVITCNMWFAPPTPAIKNPVYTYGNLSPVTVTSEVIGQFYVRLFFGLELVLVMIRVDAEFKL